MKKNRPLLPVFDFIGLITILALSIHGQNFLGDPGAGWHLRAGQWIFDNGTLPGNDPFLLHLGAAPAWIHDQWLSDLGFWICYQFGQAAGLYQLVIGIIVSTFFLVLLPTLNRFAAPTSEASDFARTIAIVLAMGVASVQWFFRPVLLSVLLFACVYSLCIRFQDSRLQSQTGIYCLFPLFALWSNLHPAFWLGLFLLAAHCLVQCLYGQIKCSKAAAIFFLGLAATLLNPWGYRLWESTLGLAFDPYFTSLNPHRQVLSPFL